MGENHEELAQAGLKALQASRASEARAAFERVVAAGTATPRLQVLLGQACWQLRDLPGAQRALDAALAAEPRNLEALVLRGDVAAAGGDDRAASAFYGLALSSAAGLKLAPPIVARLQHAEQALAAANARYTAHLRESLSNVAAGSRFAEALAIVTGEAQPQFQQPTSFFYPGLAHRAFFEADEFDWAPTLVEAAPAIRAELEAVLASEQGLKPYVEADPSRPNRGHTLLGDPSWSAFHLWEGGQPVAGNAERCPATMAALAPLPIPVIAGRSPMALFSVLKGGTHIPPHHGMLNTRLIVHLPLIVPDGCRLRVGNETRPCRADELMIFDDSIEHEAWNDSNETRVVLLFEIWRPELSAAERAGLTKLFESIGSYGRA